MVRRPASRLPPRASAATVLLLAALLYLARLLVTRPPRAPVAIPSQGTTKEEPRKAADAGELWGALRTAGALQLGPFDFEGVAKSRSPTPPKIPPHLRQRITLGTVAGENCNRILAIAVGVALAMSNNSVFVLWGGWKDTVARDLDINLFRSYVGDSVAFEEEWPQNALVLHEDAQEQIWCGSKASLSVIRHGMRPREEWRNPAEQALREMRAKGGKTIVALHGRNQRKICRKRTNKYPDFCHEDSLYDNEKRVFDICDYSLTPELAKVIVNEWPQHDFASSAVYLMTDRERPDIDATYFRPSLPSPFIYSRHDNASVFTDLWAASLADFYVANPISSCEGIVAQWRANLHESVRQFPSLCYEPYAKPQATDRDLCRHTRVYTLGDPADLGPCEMLVAVAVALTKMHQGGRLVLWGKWRELFESQVDMDRLAKARRDVQFVFTTKMPHSMPWTLPRNWQAVRLNATQEVRCAAGKPLRALRAYLRPRAPVVPVGANSDAGASSNEKLDDDNDDDDNDNNNSLLPFCFRAAGVKDARPIAKSSPNTVLWNLWLRAGESKAHSGRRWSACDYVLAHWTSTVSNPPDCYGEKFLAEDEPMTEILAFTIRKATPYWRSKHIWHCGEVEG